LGGGRTKLRLVGPSGHGRTAHLANGMVYRPASGTITVTADLWVDEMGSYSTDAAIDAYVSAETPTDEQTAAYLAAVQKGWAGKTATALGPGSGMNWLTATFGASVNATVGAPSPVAAPTTNGSEAGPATAGVSILNDGAVTTDSAATPNPPVGQAVFVIGPDSAHCSRTNNHSAIVNIHAIPGTNAIHPGVVTGRSAGLGSSPAVRTLAAIAQLRIVCPPQ